MVKVIIFAHRDIFSPVSVTQMPGESLRDYDLRVRAEYEALMEKYGNLDYIDITNPVEV